jgi:hypothetical protein
MVGCAGYRSAVGFFLYLRAMRRWFTLAGLVLVLVGLFGHFRPILLIGFALIALQRVMTIWVGVSEAKTIRSTRAKNESTRLSGQDDLD